MYLEDTHTWFKNLIQSNGKQDNAGTSIKIKHIDVSLE